MSDKPIDESDERKAVDEAAESESPAPEQPDREARAVSGGIGDEIPGNTGTSSDPAPSGKRSTSRRAVFAGAGVGAALAGIAGVIGGRAWEASTHPEEAILTVYPFRGDHQAGITTPAQDNMFTAAFDVSTTAKVEDLKKLLSDWAVAAEQMCAGELIGGEPSSNKQFPPKDTGEAWGYKPNGLTITFGVGKSLFVDAQGQDRFGLAGKLPAILSEGMPSFRGDQLHAAQSDGDLLVQACSNDAQVCVHAIRNLARIAFGTAALKWSQVGYGRTSSTSVDQETPRNLFGFKDGTNNIKAEDSTEQLNEHLWVQSSDDAGFWMAGGTYYVARRIHMFAEIWDRIRLIEQEQIMGRDKRYGAPLSITAPTKSSEEFTAVDYAAKDDKGETLVPEDAHIAVVSPEQNQGRRMLRRGYNYTDGTDSLGRLQTGLFFVAFVRDPRTNFYPILDRMTKSDALQEYLQHEASALFAIPPGMKKGDTMIAATLFD